AWSSTACGIASRLRRTRIDRAATTIRLHPTTGDAVANLPSSAHVSPFPDRTRPGFVVCTDGERRGACGRCANLDTRSRAYPDRVLRRSSGFLARDRSAQGQARLVHLRCG